MFINRFAVLAIACAMGFAPVHSFGQASKSEDREQQVLKAEGELFSAEVHGDVAAMNRLYADNYTHTHTSGMVQSKADFVDGFRTGARKYAVVNTSDVKVRFYSDTMATVTGHVTTSVNPEGQLDTFLEVWVLDNGTWRCAAWAQTKPPAKK